MNISDCTKKELEYYIEECNFTEPQQVFFRLRSKGLSIETVAERMNLSVSGANVLSKKVREKMQKVNSY